MIKQSKPSEAKQTKVVVEHKRYNTGDSSGWIYFLGLVGSASYYISTATGFWNGVWGVIKSFFWPAILTFGLLKFIGA